MIPETTAKSYRLLLPEYDRGQWPWTAKSKVVPFSSGEAISPLAWSSIDEAIKKPIRWKRLGGSRVQQMKSYMDQV